MDGRTKNKSERSLTGNKRSDDRTSTPRIDVTTATDVLQATRRKSMIIQKRALWRELPYVSAQSAVGGDM